MKMKKIALSAAAIFQMLTVSGMAPEPSEPDQHGEMYQVVYREDDDTRDPVVKYTTEAWRLAGLREESVRSIIRDFPNLSRDFPSCMELLTRFITIVCSMRRLIYTLERMDIDFLKLRRPILIIGTSSQVSSMLAEFSQFLTRPFLARLSLYKRLSLYN
jgi:hypothetical protein